MSHHEANHADCGGCTFDPERRAFLRHAAAASAAVLLALGAGNAAAMAPLSFTRGSGGHGPAKAYAIPAKDGAEIDRDNEVILVRWQGAVYAFALSCPHQNTALRWNGDSAQFQCPKHKSKYKPDGTFIEGRATRGMDRYAITRQGPNVSVDLNTVFEEDVDEAKWAAAVIKV